MSSLFKSIAKIVPVVAPFIPGVGTAASIALGAAGGALSGGGIKGALGGALTAGALGGGGKLLGSALGATGTAASTLGTGLLGAGAGGLSGGGLKGALVGGGLGALGGYASGGGFEGTAIGDLIGSPAGTPLGGGLQGPTQGSGALGAITGGGSGSGLLGGNGFSNLAKFSPVLNAVGAFNEYGAQDEIEEKLREQQLRSEGILSPFTTAKFEPGDLTQDPGYQFRLEQGQQALDRSLAASGSMQSGRALKAAQEFGQGLADQTYNDAYRRWLQNQQFNLGATGAMTGVYDNIGNIGAGAEVGKSNALSKALSSLGGTGARTIIGYDPRTGAPIYSE